MSGSSVREKFRPIEGSGRGPPIRYFIPGAWVVDVASEGSSVTAVGDTINLASRLQAQVSEGELLLSEETFRRTRDWLQEQELPAKEESLTLKGFSQTIRAYRLTAPSPAGATGLS